MPVDAPAGCRGTPVAASIPSNALHSVPGTAQFGRFRRRRKHLRAASEVEGLVDFMVRGGSSPLGRTAKALHSGALIMDGRRVWVRQRAWTCHVATLAGHGQASETALPPKVCGKSLLETTRRCTVRVYLSWGRKGSNCVWPLRRDPSP